MGAVAGYLLEGIGGIGAVVSYNTFFIGKNPQWFTFKAYMSLNNKSQVRDVSICSVSLE